METNNELNPHSGAMRWIVVVANLFICEALISSITGGRHIGVDITQSLCLLAVALAIYVWIFDSTATGVFLSLVTSVCLLWAWAITGSSALGLDLGAFAVLLFFAIWRNRKRLRRIQHMQQILADLGEERFVKEQASTISKQTHEAMQKKLSRYTQLQSIAEELSNMTELFAIAKLAVERAFDLIGKSDACLLFLVDKERQELSLFASKKRQSIASVRTKHGDQFDRYILRTLKPLLVNDVRRDFRFTVVISPERSVSSVIACPLLLDGNPEGVLRLDSSHPGSYTQDDLRFLDILLDLVATAMMNARLFAQAQKLAITDGLTGLMLRRPFQEQLTRELARATRSREPLSVLMIDVDHFKSYNDAHGHTAGDLILKSIADVLRTASPSDAMIARYGGEEFSVLLPRLARSQASDVAEHIRRFVEQHVDGDLGDHINKHNRGGASPLKRAAEGVRKERVSKAMDAILAVNNVSVSIGVSTFPDDAQVELELIRVADQRLYEAKRAGRNLVVSS